MPACQPSRLGIVAIERGAELVEFAFVLPTLLLVMWASSISGLLFQSYEVVTNAAGEGARVAILPGYNNADVQARVNQYLTAGGLTGTATVSGRRATGTFGRQSVHHGAAGDRRAISISFCSSDRFSTFAWVAAR